MWKSILKLKFKQFPWQQWLVPADAFSHQLLDENVHSSLHSSFRHIWFIFKNRTIYAQCPWIGMIAGS